MHSQSRPPGVSAAEVAAMTLAITRAQEAGEAGEIPIGAVVIDSAGDVLASAANARESRKDPSAHAEVLALREAAQVLGEWRLTECTLVVTLEPCPMCAGAAMMSRVRRVVFGAWNDDYGAAGSRWDLLRDRRLPHVVEVQGGLYEDVCGTMVSDFLAQRRSLAAE